MLYCTVLYYTIPYYALLLLENVVTHVHFIFYFFYSFHISFLTSFIHHFISYLNVSNYFCEIFLLQCIIVVITTGCNRITYFKTIFKNISRLRQKNVIKCNIIIFVLVHYEAPIIICM
jgi:hypothetical protein